MKFLLFAVIGFALGLGAAMFVKKNPSFQLPTTVSGINLSKITAPLTSAGKSFQQTEPLGSAARPTLQIAIAPVYDVLFGSLRDAKAVAVAIEETAELEKLLLAAPRNDACDAARRVGGIMKAARLETERTKRSRTQPVSTALGSERESEDFFGNVYEQRWRANMKALGNKAAPEWQRFTAIEASATYPADFQSAIGTLLAKRQQRHLERTAILIVGVLSQFHDDGAIIHRDIGDNVFVARLTGSTDAANVRVLAHEEGFYKCVDPQGSPMTLRKFRFFRNALRRTESVR